MKKAILAIGALKVLLIVTAFVAGGSKASAQNYMVVDSEKIFRSIGAYTSALAEVESDSKNYQKQIDDAFDQLEQTYNTYQQRKASLSASERAREEQRIVTREEEIKKFQSDTFGEQGTVMKKRLSTIKPIQDRVFAAIEKYAAGKGYDIVLDIASNPTILYHKPAVDHTNAIIEIVK